MIGAAMMTVSGQLIRDVRSSFYSCLNEMAARRTNRKGINGYSQHGLATYVVAVASVEAFVNEAFLVLLDGVGTGVDAMSSMPDEWLKDVEIGAKILLFPQLLLGRTLKRDAEPYQDMRQLIRVRNALTHYKMTPSVPKCVGDLVQRGIGLTPQDTRHGVAWPEYISCSEGVRWAHNTACKTVQSLISLIPEPDRFRTKYGEVVFESIEELEVLGWFRDRGIDPTSDWGGLPTHVL